MDISGITSIFSGDLLNINHIVIVESVGVGGANRLLVQRDGWDLQCMIQLTSQSLSTLETMQL